MSSVPLAELADVTMGQSPDSTIVGEGDYGLPFLQGSAEFGRISPTSLLRCARPPREAKAGSILISVRAPVGQMNAADQDYCIGRGLGAFAAKPGIANTSYLKHAVERNLPWLHRRSQGSTFAAISADDLRCLPVPRQSPQRQDEIAAVFAASDAAIEGTEALIEKHQQIKAGLMHDLFTRGVLPNGQLRSARLDEPHLYRKTVLGWIPADWGVDQLSERVEVVDPNPSHRYPGPSDEGVPLISTENFEGEDEIRIDNASRVPRQTFVFQNARCRFSPMDVVFARKGQIGLARRYGKEDKTFSHTVVIMKPIRQTCDAAWLLWAARSAWLLNHIDRTMNSNSGVPTLGVAFIKAVPLPFPPAAEQQQIASVLDAATERINSLAADLRKLRAQKLGLMQDLLTGRVCVPVASATAAHA